MAFGCLRVVRWELTFTHLYAIGDVGEFDANIELKMSSLRSVSGITASNILVVKSYRFTFHTFSA